MFKRSVIIIAFMSIYAAFVNAEKGVSDPMKPPVNYVKNKKASSNNKTYWHLSAILVSAERKLAMINNKLLAVGERVNGAKVKAIYANRVELDVDGEIIIVNPPVKMLRKKVASE